jgi:transcription-repair coupling factor (superfamily II helicase)
VLPPATIKRLQALREFNELGSGFNLAMRDLEIRGAGNLLGAEQSGFIESMGFETYTRILEEAVQELKQQEFRELFAEDARRRRPARDTVVEPEFDAVVPESYVPSDTERLALYRRLYALTTDSQLAEVAGELRDRFGAFPAEVENLFGIVRLRLHASLAGFRKINISESAMEIEFPPETDEEFYRGTPFQAMMTTIAQRRGRGMTLKQTASSLRLQVSLAEVAPGAKPLEAGLEVLRLLSIS